MATVPALNSIVVGDVGSGKTAVALSVGCAYLLGLPNGLVVMMAPTEVVAVQHYNALVQYLQNLDSTILPICLTQKIKFINSEKATSKQIDKVLTGGQERVFVVGTQALLHRELQPDMVLVDEQHRFGVLQRGAFAETDLHPHYISFSATPIPRTLALTVYKHLDIQKLERLPGRSRIETKIVPLSQKEQLITLFRQHVAMGNKIFLVTSAIEEDETDETIVSQKMIYEWLATSFEPSQIVVTHGKEKEKVSKLQKFREDPTIAFCLATSVVEVGVDVSQATVMVIINAERFGLAALHQLRGRIGRNTRDDNTCILLPATASKRLEVLCSTQDGFRIAEEDLNQRGAGSLIGTNQSGFDDTTALLLELKSQMYTKLTQAVEDLDFNDPSLQRLRTYVTKKFKETWKE